MGRFGAVFPGLLIELERIGGHHLQLGLLRGKDPERRPDQEAEDERHQRHDEARHAADHVARMIEPQPIRQIRAKRQADEGRDKSCDEEGESETERCRGHGLGLIHPDIRGPR